MTEVEFVEKLNKTIEKDSIHEVAEIIDNALQEKENFDPEYFFDAIMNGIILAVEKSHTRIAEFLIDCILGLQMTGGFTLIHWAAGVPNAKLIKLIIAKGSNVNQTQENKITPLQIAAFQGYPEVAQALIEHKADVNTKDEWGNSSLHQAVAQNHPEIVKLLLEHKADVNIQNEVKWTPLHLAAYKGFRGIAELLLNAGANKDLKNSEGLIAFDLAKEHGHKDISQLLENR